MATFVMAIGYRLSYSFSKESLWENSTICICNPNDKCFCRLNSMYYEGCVIRMINVLAKINAHRNV